MTGTPSPLGNISLLTDLGNDARNALAGRCTWRTYSQAQEIIGKESDSRDVYFIASGSARVVNWSYAGREVSFEDILAGGTFGELAAIDGAPRSATVVALEPTEVGSVDPETFMTVMLENPATARHLMERLTSIIRRSTERIFDLSVYGTNIRIYADLLRLAEPATDGSNSAVIVPIPIHSDIAARVSTTREKDRLIIPDTDLLAEMIED
jgi:CRP/FNR family transcriptional regulator, cyclic AMP receptor protein